MSGPLLIGVYQPGATVLHRLPVGPKVAGLAAFSLAVVLVRSMPASFCWLALAALGAALARVPLAALVRSARAILLVAVVLAALQWWLEGRGKAVETLVDLLALVLAALVVSATTPVHAMLDAIVRWLGPARRLGVDPDRVALTFSLAIQALPGTVALAVETRDAARARGLGRHPRAYLTPFVIRVVARAHETGDALHARGLGDEDPDEGLTTDRRRASRR
ncbi:CbiQ family ECF transporter T component [Nocardioides pantholopis]|uniref:CbiQ family ECF transporter T component n=1 Tax=Nocardioides pantholopis TaxID=2483798 RepID=UPI000F07C627|nr:CbiQ family ECF transporter T component [Nocardioides pantholopis]